MCVLGVSLILVSTFFLGGGGFKSLLVSPFYVLYTSCMMIQQDCDKKSPPVKTFFLESYISLFFIYFFKGLGEGRIDLHMHSPYFVVVGVSTDS